LGGPALAYDHVTSAQADDYHRDTRGEDQPEKGPYARIAMLRPLDGHTVEFEAGYIRHLEWHRQAGDPWAWYGWTISLGDRTRSFIYASFGHAASDFDHVVDPVDEERDNVRNVAPHCECVASAVYEYLPALSRGDGTPRPVPRTELMTVELTPGAAKTFEAALGAGQAKLQADTLWYRMVSGGSSPRYVRIRPVHDYAALLTGAADAALPDTVNRLVVRATIESLTLRPAMSYGVTPEK
jgi:hypothetical protein